MNRRQQKRLLYELEEMSDLEAFFRLVDLSVRTNLNPFYADATAPSLPEQPNETGKQRRKVSLRRENFMIFLYMQGIVGAMALVPALLENGARTIYWLITSFIFSAAMFVTYKALLILNRGLEYLSQQKSRV